MIKRIQLEGCRNKGVLWRVTKQLINTNTLLFPNMYDDIFVGF